MRTFFKKLFIFLNIFYFELIFCSTTINKITCSLNNGITKAFASGKSTDTQILRVLFTYNLPNEIVTNDYDTIFTDASGNWSISDVTGAIGCASSVDVDVYTMNFIRLASSSANCPCNTKAITNMLINNTFAASESQAKSRAEIFNFSNSRLGVEGLTHPRNRIKLVVDQNTNNEKSIFAKVFNHRWYAVLPRLSIGQHTLDTIAITPRGTRIKLVNTFNNDTNNHIIIKFPAHRIIKDIRPIVTGDTGPNSIVQIFIDDVSVGQVTADENGRFRKKVPFDLAQGQHKIKVTSLDTKNHNALEQDIFLVDISTSVQIDSPANNSTITTNRPTISGTTVRHNEINIFVDGQRVKRIKDSLAHWSFKLPFLKNGEHSIRVKAKNNQGAIGNDNIKITINATSENLARLDIVEKLNKKNVS